MSRKITTIEGLFGEKLHYDENGNKVGESWPGLFGGSYDHYDENGKYAGYSDPGIISDYNHYDAGNHRVGSSQRGVFGGYNHYDNDGYKGHTIEGIFDSVTEIEDD